MTDYAKLDDAMLETLATGTGEGTTGAARAELTRRQREYELGRDRRRIEHENQVVDVEARLAAVRQEFEERLHREQMAHQSTIAEKQIQAARQNAHVALFAAVAAWGSAIAAIAALAWQAFGRHLFG